MSESNRGGELIASMSKPASRQTQAHRLMWQEMLPHIKAGDFLEVSGNSAVGPYLLVMQPDMNRRLTLVYVRSGRQVSRPETAALAQNKTFRVNLASPSLDYETLNRASEKPEEMLNHDSELVISNVFSLTTGQAVCMAGTVQTIQVRHIKAWEIPARAADEALLADLSLEADMAHLAERVREVLAAQQVSNNQLKAGICYVLGQWGGSEMTFAVENSLAILVVENFDRQIALARFLERISLNPIMHGRIVRNDQAELILLCPDAAQNMHRAIQLEYQNAMLSLYARKGEMTDVLKIEQENGPKGTVRLSYQPSPHFQNVLVWCLPPGTATAVAPRAMANVWLDLGPGRVRLAEGVNIVGRWPGLELRADDPSISGRHCELLVKEGQVMVRDLGSTNGTFADGVRVESTPLPLKQMLQVGSLRCQLHFQDVEIRIPERPQLAPPPLQYDYDGWPMCHMESQLRATHQCSKCGLPVHYQNARQVGLAGSSKRLLFCPACDSPCVALNAPAHKSGSVLKHFYHRVLKWLSPPPTSSRSKRKR